MARWGVQLHFANRTMTLFGEERSLRLSATRHPVVQLLELEPGSASNSTWDTREMYQLKETLIHQPHQMAFLEGVTLPEPERAAIPESATDESDSPAAAEEEDWQVYTAGLTPGETDAINLAAIQTSLDYETAVTEVLMKDAFQESTAAPEDISDTEGSISSGVSETSHEVAAPPDSDSADSSEDEEFQERHGEHLHSPMAEPFTKGQRRKVTNAVNQVLLGFNEELEPKLKTQAERERVMAQGLYVPRPIKRRTGWKILEVFTWTCLLSRFAHSIGWQMLEPITIPNWNLSKPSDIRAALEYIDRENPDLLMIAWPCKKWSGMQNMNMRTEVQIECLEATRLQERKTFLSFTRQAVLKQRARNKAVLGENPLRSKAWKTPEITDAFEGLPEAVIDQCAYGLVHPENGIPIQKTTRFMGQEDVLSELHQRCNGQHPHERIEGSVHVNGRTVHLSEYCGGYSLCNLCKAIMKGAEKFLNSAPASAPRYHHEIMAEEMLKDGDEGVVSEAEEPDPEVEESRMLPEDPQEKDLEEALDDSYEDPEQAARVQGERHAQEEPEPAAPDGERFSVAPEIRKAVEQAHRQLGHPSRQTLVRMLRLSGATDAAVKYAKEWRCDVCAHRVPPKHPAAAAPGVRPYGFNRSHQVDLKYVRDERGKRYVFLSMIDIGTLFHQAVMLKTRQSEYVASKWVRHWYSQFGCPSRMTHDQGGEFEKGFVAMVEELSFAYDRHGCPCWLAAQPSRATWWTAWSHFGDSDHGT